jgi:hypothetical protein
MPSDAQSETTLCFEFLGVTVIVCCSHNPGQTLTQKPCTDGLRTHIEQRDLALSKGNGFQGRLVRVRSQLNGSVLGRKRAEQSRAGDASCRAHRRERTRVEDHESAPFAAWSTSLATMLAGQTTLRVSAAASDARGDATGRGRHEVAAPRVVPCSIPMRGLTRPPTRWRLTAVRRDVGSSGSSATRTNAGSVRPALATASRFSDARNPQC